jgi:ATP-dependent helicase/nuclease subunit A
LKEKNTLTEHQFSALDIDNNIALTANAGSGKTFVLSKRFLEIAVNRNIPLRKIAAITFTEKAASELYKKIASQVEDIIASSADPVLNEKLYRIRRSLVSANISTIHSFCINLLKEYPVEADLDANFIPVDTNTSYELMEMAVDSVIRTSLSNEDSAKLKSIIRLFSSRRTFATELINLISNRKNVIELKNGLYNRPSSETAELLYEKFINITDSYLKKHLPKFLSALESMLNKVYSADPSNKIAVEARGMTEKIKQEKQTESLIITLTHAAEIICTDKGEIRKLLVKKTPDVSPDETDIIEEYLCNMKYFAVDDQHKEIESVLAGIGTDMLYFFDKALHKYEEKKRSKGYLDFEDILLMTKKLLEDNSVKESVWQKFDYIMIDEYQDTNEIQYEIFLPILDHLKRGNLFVVGDEKQSIYMFRDAELEVFERTKEQIKKDTSGKLLLLPDSFRMAPGICLFTNYIFRRLFADPDITFNEVSYSDLVCARSNVSGGETAFLLDTGEGQSEADLISLQILELRKNKNLKWNDAAVLSRKRKSFDELEESFVKYNIPYMIMGGRNFYQRQSIYDIYNYFSFLLDNNNDAALAGILRSPFFNISDSVLYEISLNRGFTFYNKLLTSDDEILKPVIGKLRLMVSAAAYTEAPVLLRMMLEQSDFIAYLSAKRNGSQETANINKLIKVTINYYSQGFRTLYDYVSFLKTSIEQTEDESQAVIADDSNTVKIMTIHQAKGLEFPAVFLFKAGESALRNTVKQKSIIINKSLGILTKVPLKENYYEDYNSAPIVNLNNFISLKKSHAELKRLLYVGVTRARDFLYITACQEEKYPYDSFMGLLMKALALEFSPEGFSISDNLNILKKNDVSFQRLRVLLNLNIPVITKIEEHYNLKETDDTSVKKMLLNPINDSVEEEIISATRFSVYNHCPLKYKFNYIDGLLPLIKPPVYGSLEEDKDDEITAGLGGIKGSVIHKILQKDSGMPAPEAIKNIILKEEPLINSASADTLACEIISDLKNYYNSAVYKEIRNKKGDNEYEVYFRENDYILYGIIDKLLIEDNTITIIDYKTDDIPADKSSQRAAEYFNQLKFYSYIIWNVFNCSCKIIFKIIFIKHPDKCFQKEEFYDDLLQTGSKIREMVHNTRSNIFLPDKNHCSKCVYSTDHVNCIKRN